MAQRHGPEGGHLAVEGGADARHLRLADARRRPQRRHQIVHLAGRHPMHVGLHHHRKQRPVDPATSLQDRRKETAVTQLGNTQLHTTSLGGQQPFPAPIPPIRSPLCSLVTLGADHLHRLGLDQRLQHQLHPLTHHVQITASTNRVQKVMHVRLRQGHRAPPKLELGRSSRRSPGDPPQVVDPGFYTTK